MWVTDRGHLPTELFFSRNKLPKSTKSRRIKPTFWEEHCTECSVPECYKSCKLYTAKKDGSCRRFEHGIVLERGDYSPTARIFFKKWGKLQTKWIKGDAKYGFILYVSMAFGILHRLVETLPFSNRNRERFHRYFRNALERLVFNSSNTEEMFQYVLTLRSSSEHMPTGFVLEQIQDNQVINRITFNIKDKRETIRIPLKTPTSTESFVQIFPIMAQGVEVTFAELEIERTNGVTQVQDGQIEVQPKFEGKFVKCVAWDLDLTIWDEILTESNSDQLKIRPQIIETLEELDRRGILNVVISKNDFDSAMEQLRRFDLDKWFVGYSINWGEKSAGLKKLSASLNLNLDSFLFVDDSLFERSEVTAAFPYIRTCDQNQVFETLKAEFMKPPISEESKLRRLRYKTEAIRIESRAKHGDDYHEFLLSSNLKLNLKEIHVDNDAEIGRAYELLSRTNQLNLSGNRYSEIELQVSIQVATGQWLVGTLTDTYGDYGAVLVARLERNNKSLILTDFALSCRAAERFVEAVFLEFVRKKAVEENLNQIKINYVETSKNNPLKRSFHEAGVSFSQESSLPLKEVVPNSDLVQISINFPS